MSKFIGSARKGKKGKTLKVKVRSNGSITNLKVQVRDAKNRVVATGALKKLNGLGTLKLKVKRSLKKGKYTVRGSAKVNGATKTFRQTVFAKK
jgi:flagellar hook assembly protein FlgD